MKKFLIFLVSIVVAVSVGLTTFYFMKNDEVITIETKEIYVNAGDTISLEELGITRKKPSKKTTFNYNAGGEDVKSAISFDKKKGYYVVNGNVAGDIQLVITTSNEKYAEFTVMVHVGNGEKETPYYVFNETDLSKIGADYALNDHFKLMNNIVLSSNFEPVGYSQADARFVGFSGVFDGNGYTISGLNLTDKALSSAGLFSSINASATVSNLKIANATISGDYEKAGVLAGSISGNVDRIAVLSSNVTSKAANANIGALAGSVDGSVKLSYAENSSINVGTDTAVTDVVAGGLIGKINQATVQACYVDNTTVNVVANSTGKFGGFAGEFVVDTNKGSIQQSYANVTSTESNFGAFVGTISKSASFAGTANDAIKYLIGNAVVLDSKDIVKNYDSTIFTYFKNVAKSTYLIDSFASVGEMQIAADTDNGLVYYAVSSLNVVYWDNEYIWETSNNALPKLRFTRIDPTVPSGEYFRKDLANNEINQTTTKFEDVFANDVSNSKYTLLSDVTLTNWTPVNLTNVTFDGGNKTITLAISNKKGENAGLFAKLDNCTIKNLNIVVTNVTVNATNIGALAGEVLSNDANSLSSIENVSVSFNSVGNVTATNFGGLVALADKTNISDVEISALNTSANIANVGGVVAQIKKDAKLTNATVVETLSATENVGGVAAINEGTISGVANSNVTVNYNSNVEAAKLGGIVATNGGNILKSNVEVAININNANKSIYAGGAVAINNGSVSSVNLTGNGIAVAQIDASVYAGGVASENLGTISTVKNEMATVGANHTGKNIYSAGVAYKNNGSISQVVTKSNVLGNYAAGVVVEMNSSSATVDQVVVSNTIKGDKYVAGIVVTFKSGTITNIQATSTIEGLANTTRSSLVTLIFPYGAKLKNATINSSIGGYGTFYRETWLDFASYSNKAEFGFSAGDTGDNRFNLFANDTHHGSMQSVVINTGKAGAGSAKSAMGSAFAWSKEYTDSAESSFVKTVNGFSSINQFTGSFEFVCATSSWFGIEHKVTKTLTFGIGSIWKDNGSGISLIFADNLN